MSTVGNMPVFTYIHAHQFSSILGLMVDCQSCRGSNEFMETSCLFWGRNEIRISPHPHQYLWAQKASAFQQNLLALYVCPAFGTTQEKTSIHPQKTEASWTKMKQIWKVHTFIPLDFSHWCHSTSVTKHTGVPTFNATRMIDFEGRACIIKALISFPSPNVTCHQAVTSWCVP